MFKNYKDEGHIVGIKEQHNIMIFIGNGFDISVLRKYRDDGLVSSYSKFYDFLCYKGFNEDNMLYKKMREDKSNGKENWSDFECLLYLDKYQFEAYPYKTVDTNFDFHPNPNGFSKMGMDERTVWSSFVMVDMIHPHGYQNIPRSLLFGIENNEYVSDRVLNRFNKSYWVQSNQKYKSYFDDVKLFIIYGTSIGETDNWWWKNVYNCLLNGNSELIIYFYCNGCVENNNVKQMFVKACKIEASEEEISMVKEKIYVVMYDESCKKMFALKNAEEV